MSVVSLRTWFRRHVQLFVNILCHYRPILPTSPFTSMLLQYRYNVWNYRLQYVLLWAWSELKKPKSNTFACVRTVGWLCHQFKLVFNIQLIYRPLPVITLETLVCRFSNMFDDFFHVVVEISWRPLLDYCRQHIYFADWRRLPIVGNANQIEEESIVIGGDVAFLVKFYWFYLPYCYHTVQFCSGLHFCFRFNLEYGMILRSVFVIGSKF